MKITHKITPIITIILTFYLLNNASALSYQSSELVSFTFAPTVQITISDNLTIPSLSPGDGKDSNIITVTASSNSIAGYTLSSSVGSTSNPSTELRKDGTSTTHKFDSITTNKPSLSDFNGNDWGYSYSTDSGTTWQSGDITGTPATGYNGLPLYTTETPIKLINSTTSDTNSIEFKIGASATSTQVAGEYTNIINFIGVANPNPEPIYMQDATLADCGKSMVDRRDHNVYSTTLIGDTCWMTKNLDLPGGTRLSSDDTDFESTYELPTTNGWATTTDGKLIMPASSTEGFDQNNFAYVFNSGRTSTSDSGCTTPGCYSYYSWDTATVGSGRNITADNTDAPYSICPKGWHLPNTRTGTDETSDFRKLMVTLGGSATIETYGTNTIPTGATMFGYLSNEPLNYLRAGYYNGSTFYNGGSSGYYWSATSSSGTVARFLGFRSPYVNSTDYNYRRDGFSVRCILNQ